MRFFLHLGKLLPERDTNSPIRKENIFHDLFLDISIKFLYLSYIIYHILKKFMPTRYHVSKIDDFQLLKGRVFEKIKRGIISLSLLPGQQLVEQRLAEELGVSKSPIREAFLKLEEKGLVHTIPYKGCFVTEITQKEIEHTFQLREALETYCVRLICETLAEDGIIKLKKIISRGEKALHKNDVKNCYAANTLFHDALIGMTNNSKITQSFLTLRDHLDRYRNIASRIGGRVEKSHQDHVSIFESIEEKDAIQSSKKMSAHIRDVLQDILSSEEFQAFFR
jgi:DNA-binding GntR family transcriptional regulator